MKKLHSPLIIIDFRVGPFDLLVELWSHKTPFKMQREHPDCLVVDVWRLCAMFTFHRKNAHTDQMTQAT